MRPDSRVKTTRTPAGETGGGTKALSDVVHVFGYVVLQLNVLVFSLTLASSVTVSAARGRTTSCVGVRVLPAGLVGRRRANRERVAASDVGCRPAAARRPPGAECADVPSPKSTRIPVSARLFGLDGVTVTVTALPASAGLGEAVTITPTFAAATLMTVELVRALSRRYRSMVTVIV